MDIGGLRLRLCQILYISKWKEIEDYFKPALNLKYTSVYVEQDDYFKIS